MRFGTAIPLLTALTLAACGSSPSEPASQRAWQLTRDGVLVDGKVQIALPDWVWVKETYACPPVLATGPAGEAVVSSNVVPILWRIDAKTLVVTEHRLQLDADTDKDVGFTGLAWSAEHGAYFAVRDPQGTLWKIDPLLRRAQRIALSDPIPGACGMSVSPRTAPAAKTLRAARLCTVSREGRWSIDLAPDQRAAYARRATGQECSALPANLAWRED